jgi:hypothetical protein
MGMLKGFGLGILLWFGFTVVYFWANGMFGSNVAVTGSVTRSLTIGSPLYWTVTVLLLALGLALVAIWPTKIA